MDRDGRNDNKKVELLTWAEYNVETLRHQLFATGTTGTLLEYELGLKRPMVSPGAL